MMDSSSRQASRREIILRFQTIMSDSKHSKQVGKFLTMSVGGAISCKCHLLW